MMRKQPSLCAVEQPCADGFQMPLQEALRYWLGAEYSSRLWVGLYKLISADTYSTDDNACRCLCWQFYRSWRSIWDRADNFTGTL